MPLRTPEDLRQLLDRAEGDAVAGGEHERGHDGGADERRAEEFADARPPERAGTLLLSPYGALRQEGTNENQRQGGDHAGDQRVPPGFVASLDHRQHVGEPGGEHVGRAHQQAAERREGLRPAEHPLPLLAVWKELGQPGDRRHKLHAHADEDQAAAEQQEWQRRDKPCGEGREGVEQDAVGEHPPAAEQIREVAAEQTKHAAGEGRHEE